jgi:hypothetical protein
MRESFCVRQSAGEFREAGELGAAGVGFVRQAPGARAVSLSPGRGQTRTQPPSLPALVRWDCAGRTALHVIGGGPRLGAEKGCVANLLSLVYFRYSLLR